MIYFIEAKSVGLIKIGYTSGDPDVRFGALQTGSAVKLSKLALLAGTKRREWAIHRRFRGAHSHGEWFRDSTGIRHYVAAKAGPWEGKNFDAFLMPAEIRKRHADERAKLARSHELLRMVGEERKAESRARRLRERSGG